MSVGRALAQVCVAHGFQHFGEIELARTLVGATTVSGISPPAPCSAGTEAEP